jgi:tetratricopeptide (TPR) repeat protein
MTAVTHARRTLLLLFLLAVYLAPTVRSMAGEFFRRGAFDPFLPAARALEQRIGEGRFADALPLARELERTYPGDAQVAFWLARVHQGLNDSGSEAAAWERYITLSAAPEEACPSLPEAYARAGRLAESLQAYERCAAFDDGDVVRLVDLGEAYARAHRTHDAIAQYERAASIDPGDPNLVSRMTALRGAPGDTQ